MSRDIDIDLTAARMAELRQKLEYHNYLYYVQDSPEISDADYDKLRQRLKAIEARFPQLVDLLSPTKQVAPTRASCWGKTLHLPIPCR